MEIREYTPQSLAGYINWIYFFYAWGLKGDFSPLSAGHTVQPEGSKVAPEAWAEARNLFHDALVLLEELNTRVVPKAVFDIRAAYSDGEDIVLADGARLPLLRQQQPGTEHCLSLADFIAPQGYADASGLADRIGLFACTVDGSEQQTDCRDAYRKMLATTLCDRLAEAAAERMHEEVRREVWGYAPCERLTREQLFREDFQGIRPAIGYPSLPDHRLNFLLERLLQLGQIGIRLTSSGMMIPHSSVSGLMFAHPRAHYFSVGALGDDQQADYEKRMSRAAQALGLPPFPLKSTA